MICSPYSTIESYWIDYSNKENIRNWVDQLDLVCESSAKIGMLGSAYFIGCCIFSIVSPPMADQYGRKKIILLSYCTFLITVVAILFSRSIDLTIVLMFCAGCCLPGMLNVGYVYAYELLSFDNLDKFNLVYPATDAALNTLAICAYWFVSNNYVWTSLP